MIPAIVLSSCRGGLGVIRALGMMGVPVVGIKYHNQHMGHVSRYVTESIQAPNPEESEDQFIALLIELASQYEKSLLFATSDATVIAVSRHKSLLEQYYILACTDWDITRQFIHKEYTYALADAIGVPAPRTLVPQSLEEVEKYSREVDYPCLVKPSQSHLFEGRFGLKMVEVHNRDQMVATYRHSAQAGLEILVQEIIPGDDDDGVNYNSYVWEGEPLVEFTAKKVRNGPPGFGSPRIAVSRHIPEVFEPGRAILRAMGFHGFACTEFKKDARDGVYKLMEVNGRHNMSSSLAVRCGMNFPWIQYNHLVNGALPSSQSYQTGIYWVDLIRDVWANIKYSGREGYTLKEYIRPYVNPHTFAIFDWKDPKPFIFHFISTIGHAVSSRARLKPSSPAPEELSPHLAK